MKNNIIKFVGFVLVFTMVLSSATFAFAASDQTTDLVLDEATMESLIAREKDGWEYISEHKDEILAEIENYDKSVSNTNGVSYGGFQYLDGDIIVTRSTSYGFTGHVGIIVGTKVLDIHPDNPGECPTTMSLSTWFRRFPENIVVRYDGRTRIPTKAANYGEDFYINGDGADNTYSIASSITSKKKDYCSSLVWKCYHFGSDLDFKIEADTVSGTTWVIPSFILPTDFIMYREYNDFSIVHSVDWNW